MKKLGILLVVLAICLPAYGYVLVYKVSVSATGAVFEAEDNEPNGWLLEKFSAKGYLILAVNDSDPNTLDDAPQYIDYYTEEVDNKPTKLYDIWTAGKGFAQNILPGLPPKGKNITTVNVDLWNGDSSLELTGWLLGTSSLTDIGTLNDEDKKTKVAVAASLKGSFWYKSGTDLGGVDETLDDQGTGTFTATLDAKWTKTANDPCEGKGFDGDITAFLDPDSGPVPVDDPKAPRGLLNWLEEVQKYVLE